MSYIYFVSYVGVTQPGSFFYGNSDVKMNKEMNSISDVCAIEDGVKKELDIQGVSITILSYSLLNVER